MTFVLTQDLEVMMIRKNFVEFLEMHLRQKYTVYEDEVINYIYNGNSLKVKPFPMFSEKELTNICHMLEVIQGSIYMENTPENTTMVEKLILFLTIPFAKISSHLVQDRRVIELRFMRCA